MYSRIQKKPAKTSFFLLGPRGTGKSTWLKKEFTDATYIDLLNTELYTQLLARPETLKNYIQKPVVILDEIQRVPELLNEVHRLIEDQKIQFVLTGSSARKLKRSGTNLLAGRALVKSFYPLTTVELGKDFDLKKNLAIGFLPAAQNHESPQEYLSAYVSTYLREEIMQEALVRNLSNFSRFLQSASFSQAQVLNVSDVARDCSVERKVVENYFSILEDLMIAQRVPVFHNKAKRELITHQKFFFFDVGVYNALRPKGPLDGPEEIQGAQLETLFFQEFRALNHYLNWEYELFYWRTKNQLEIDFIAYGPRGLWAFEIKRSRQWQKKDLKALVEFKKDYPKAEAVLFYGGETPATVDGIKILPFVSNITKLADSEFGL